jgi:hypothetical protein
MCYNMMAWQATADVDDYQQVGGYHLASTACCKRRAGINPTPEYCILTSVAVTQDAACTMQTLEMRPAMPPLAMQN